MLNKIALALVGLLLLQACSESAPPPASVPVAPAVTAAQITVAMQDGMGGLAALQGVRTLVQKGGGTRRHFGQIPATGAADPQGVLSELTETIDLDNGRAAFDNVVQIGEGFTQHRTEAYTTYKGQPLGWGTTAGRPNIVTSVNGLFSWATHNTPEILLRRNPVTIALAAAAAQDPVEERTLDGVSYWFVNTRLGGEMIGLYIDKTTSLLHAYSALDTESMWGDTNSIYVLGDYRPVGTVVLPYALEIRKDDGVYARLQYTDITLNDDSALAIFAIPADVTEQAEQVLAAGDGSWVPLQWNPVAENITHVVAFSHHSMVVEFPSFVVVVEGPYTEGQSLTLARMIEENIGKPIRYVVPTHPHYDHTGGIRGLASLGASVLVAGGHEAELRMIVEAPHSNPPDALATNLAAGAEVGRVEVFNGSTEVSEGDQTLQLYEVTGIPHVAPKVLAFVPATGVLFQSDLFFGGPGPDSTALHAAIAALELDVQQIVGGHGGVLPYSALEAAVTPQDAEGDVQ
jgi:glyoxylase-like metal-dependent hydrolase (beta-lactamase superfamily II)